MREFIKTVGLTAPICLVVEGKCGSKLGISSFICMVILIFLPPPILPLSGNWGWCNFIPIWNLRLTPGRAQCLLHNWLTDWHWHSRNRVCFHAVQSSDYSYQGPSNDVFTIADYQHWVSNCDFNENWHETKSGKQCESVIYLNYAPINNHSPRIPGNISNSNDKDISHHEDWGRVHYCQFWPLISGSGVSCFRSLYICVMQTSHTSCQHHRCHLILICPLWPIRGFGDMALANERSAITGPMVGDNKTFLQILFPSSDSPGKTTLRHCLERNQRNWSHLSLHFTFRAKVFLESVRKVITL